MKLKKWFMKFANLKSNYKKEIDEVDVFNSISGYRKVS